MLLGALQGVTEFLPISSSGHLRLGQLLLGIKEPALLFDIILHVGTLLAVVAVLHRDIGRLVVGSLRGLRLLAAGERAAAWAIPELRWAVFIVLATIPTGLLGVGLGHAFDAAINTPARICAVLILNGLILFATRWATVWMSALGLIFFVFAEQIMRLYTDNPVVIALGAAGLRPLALTQPFWAIIIVQSGALRGAGDTRYPLRVNTITIWTAVLLGGSSALTIGGGLTTVWATFLLTAPIAAYLMWRRFQRTIREGHVAAVY